MSRRRFFVDQFHSGQAALRGDQAHHLRHVLRVRAGQVFELTDTCRLYLGRVLTATDAAVTFALEQELPLPAPLPDRTLLAGVFKFDRFEWMLEKATELGVARIVPVLAARTDAGLARAAAKRVERWRRITREAAQQSRRLAPPEIPDPQPLDQALASVSTPQRWLLDESLAGPHQSPLLAPPEPAGAALLTGPEGGFTDPERQTALRHYFQPVSLGPLILRAETAPLAALAVLFYASTAAPSPTTMKDASL